jgi:hypothetical protein
MMTGHNSDGQRRGPLHCEPVRAALSGRRVFVAGHRGMVGSALVRSLEQLPADLIVRTSRELDLP